MKDVVSLVEQAEVTDTRVSDYLRGLKSIGEVYSKVSPYIWLCNWVPVIIIIYNRLHNSCIFIYMILYSNNHCTCYL